MKLLLDENISPRLADSLADLFPASLHVHALGLAQADDTTIWQYAGQHGYAVLSKDSDFYHASMIRGHPPKLIWVRLGNCSTSDIENLSGIVTRSCFCLMQAPRNPLFS